MHAHYGQGLLQQTKLSENRSINNVIILGGADDVRQLYLGLIYNVYAPAGVPRRKHL